MTDPSLVEQFRQQAVSCLPGSPLYHALLTAAADDLEAGGVVADVMAGHEADRPGTVAALRLMGAVHRVVLEGAAPDLARYYPSVGGNRPAEEAWPAFRAAIAGHRTRVRDLLEHPVQTNEVGRAAPLFGALLVIADQTGLPVRLLEVGASAGLNLLVDRFGYDIDVGLVLGDPESEVRLAGPWVGRPPAPLTAPLDVRERRGCDPVPIDARTREGQLTLMSYVWPDWIERVDRLRRAFAVADRVPVRVDRASAAAWLAAQLAAPAPGAVTVVWHSVVWQYLERAERDRAREAVLRAGQRASRDAPVAHLAFEPRRQPGGGWRFELWLTLWPGLAGGLQLGWAPGHGVPTTWTGPEGDGPIGDAGS